jgi:hypothetical protein
MNVTAKPRRPSGPRVLQVTPATLLRVEDSAEYTDTVTHSLRGLFVDRISTLPRVELVFWKRAAGRIRVWTILDEPHLETENRIYDVQLEMMDLLPDVRFDFSVIFRQGKDVRQFSPEGAIRTFSRS